MLKDSQGTHADLQAFRGNRRARSERLANADTVLSPMSNGHRVSLACGAIGI